MWSCWTNRTIKDVNKPSTFSAKSKSCPMTNWTRKCGKKWLKSRAKAIQSHWFRRITISIWRDAWLKRIWSINHCPTRLWIGHSVNYRPRVSGIRKWHWMYFPRPQVWVLIIVPQIQWSLTCPKWAGVGVRTHNAGPTHCTKLKVYRPKTCGVVPKPLDESRISSRPNTALMDNMRPMDLAICWDYRPTNPHDEPKPPTHIDGSNGSAAPAVFTLVKTPRTADDLGTGRSGGVFSNTLGEEGFFEKDVMLRNKNLFSAKLEANTNRECKCGMSAESNRQRQSSRNHLTDTRPRCKSSPNLSTIVHASNSVDTLPQKENIIVCNYNQEHYHVRPVSHKHRPHRARNNSLDKGKSTRAPRLCEQNQSMPMIGQQVQPQHVHRPELKVPFKAGIPKSNSSGTCTSFDSGCSSMSAGSACSAKLVKIPKPKNPYAKKSYIIDTLAPPFACWKGGAGQGGYPEHWRLASVYQHAYKPVQQRKRPLLATVYQWKH